MAEQVFEVGAIVQLKSSTLTMTVSETYANGTVRAQWFSQNDILHEADFAVGSLRRYVEVD
jgi:uncharacterized protein YodC (DUF2158 family)